jgi:hypothetical protein
MKFLELLLQLLLKHKKSEVTQKVEPTKEKSIRAKYSELRRFDNDHN